MGGGWEKITKGALFAFDSEAGFFFCKLVESPIVASLMVVVVAVLVDFFVGYFLLLAIFYDMGNYPNLRSKQFKLYLVAFYSIRSLSYSSTTIRQHSWDTFQRGGEIC